MANTATLLSLLNRAAPLADMVPFTALTFVTKDVATQWVNDALSRIHYLFADAGQDYFKQAQDVPLVGGVDQYALPAAMYKPIGVDEITSAGSRYRVSRYGWQERDKYQDAGGSSSVAWSEYEYLIIGSNIEVIPRPSSGTLRIYYIPTFTLLAADADPVSQVIPQGWEEYVVLDVAAKCLTKAKRDPSELNNRAAQIWQNQFIPYVSPRDMGEPKKIVDVYGRFSKRGFVR